MLLWQKQFSVVVSVQTAAGSTEKPFKLEFERQVESAHAHKTVGVRG